jgi:hypothetical protein
VDFGCRTGRSTRFLKRVGISFLNHGAKTKVIESFNPENENPYEMQKGGWQAILDNFRKYVESKKQVK